MAGRDKDEVVRKRMEKKPVKVQSMVNVVNKPVKVESMVNVFKLEEPEPYQEP